jgi:hypothetical protein
MTEKEEKIAEMMFDIWQESNKLKNPVMVGEYIANKLKEAINYTHCCTELPTKEEMHLELNNRVEDIKATSSMGSNKQMLLAYRIGFEECDDYIRKR